MKTENTFQNRDKICLPCGWQIIKGGFYLSPKDENNWAFLDMQNLYKGVKENRWKINWQRFRFVLRKHYSVTKAVVFMGFVKENIALYNTIRLAGFDLEFREVKRGGNGQIDGGNVDADLASYAMDHKMEYRQAVIIADDADYCKTIQSLDRQKKLKLIISSHLLTNTSFQIKQSVASEKIISIHGLRKQIAINQ